MYFLKYLVIISVLYVHHETLKNNFTLWNLLDLRTSNYFKVKCSSPILCHAFDFLLTQKYFEPSWKSGPARTGPAGLVPLPLDRSGNLTLECANTC